LKIAGRVQYFQYQWRKSFGNSWVTSIVTHGYFPEWQDTPLLKFTPISRRIYNDSDHQVFQREIHNLLDSGAIKELDSNVPCFTSSIFMVPKKTGDLRLVIDLRRLNQHVAYRHFKMESLDLVKSLIRREDYMVSIDLNQAFYHIPLAESQRQYFAFDFFNKRYCFTCLPFGLTASPRIFTKVLKPIIQSARAQGIRVVAYLDDLLIMATSKEEVLENLSWVINQLEIHGFTINRDKSFLTPCQKIDYLGFKIDSKSMTLKLPKAKLRSIVRECQKAKHLRCLPIRNLASLIGKIVATTNAILPARLHSRALLRDKNRGLHLNGWNGSVTLSEESLIQLDWWIKELPKWNGKTMIPEVPQSIIYTDASNLGWGATLNNQLTIHGKWNWQERLLHINHLELKAIHFALLAFKDISNQSVLIRTDNTTCVAYINHQGGTMSAALSKSTEEIWNLCLERTLKIQAEHIPGIQNVIADQASRMKTDRHDWMLNPTIFQKLNRIWGPFQVDLFANRVNSQLPKFYSWIPDPYAEATDALLQNWSNMKLWANPPWILIPRILAKIIRDKASVTLLLPYWTSAPWFPLMVDLLVAPPILLKTQQIFLPTHHNQQHPLRNPHWKILVCNLSGHGMKQKAFHQKLLNFSYHLWIQTLRVQCPQVFGHGYLGVHSIHRIPLLAL
jgi:hypothetical protein